MLSNPKTPWLALAAISFFTAYGLWQIAIREPEPSQTRLIDLPPVTEAALLTSGIDRQTLNDYLAQTSVEVPYGPVTAYASQPTRPRISSSIATRDQNQEVTPAPGRIEHPALYLPVQIKTREKRDGHSRANQVGPVAQRIEQPRPKGKVAGSNPAWPAKLTKAQLAAEVRAALPKLPAAEVEAAVWIIWRESGGRTTAKNPRSSSHGLNGFLRSTWRNVTSRSGIRHGLDPKSQILAMHHYVTRRYGSFRRAKAHHVARRWY